MVHKEVKYTKRIVFFFNLASSSVAINFYYNVLVKVRVRGDDSLAEFNFFPKDKLFLGEYFVVVPIISCVFFTFSLSKDKFRRTSVHMVVGSARTGVLPNSCGASRLQEKCLAP